MPVITCPTCGTKLEVDADQMGRSVQCGSCQQVFDAKTDVGSGRSREEQFDRDREDGEDDRSSRRRKSKYRREYDDEDEFDDDYAPRGGYQPPGGTGMGVTALVLGISAVPLAFCCWPAGGVCSILAIIFGIVSLKTAGRGMGIVGIVLGVLSLLAVVAVMVFWAGLNVWGRGFAPPPPAAPPQPQPAVRVK